MTRGRPVKRRKRSDNEGTIFQRVVKGGSGKSVNYWAVQMTLPDGTRSKQKQFKSHEEAREALLRMRAEIAQGVMPSDMTFTEWSEHWLANRRGITAKTVSQYKRNLATASRFFGHKSLAKLQTHDIEGMNNALLDDGKSSTTVRQAHNNVGTCLKAAYKRGLIAKDICSLVDAPKPLKRKPIILNRGQWKQLINASRATARELIVEFTLKTGMRINEALEITWSQVDTEAGAVTVGVSKTDAGSGRTIPLDKLLMRRLTTLRVEHYAIQMQRRGWNPSSLVFGNSAGNRNSYRNLQKRVLTPLLKELGLPHLTWHHLRHNAGSYLLSENVPITAVSKILGHANPAITMSIYAHELKEDFEQVRVAMSKFA
jgi:site-specific recombinase XerD